MQAAGRYFAAGCARFVAVRIRLVGDDGYVYLEDAEGPLLTVLPLRQLRVSARLGSLPRKLYLPDGACFETPDNEAIDQMLRASGGNQQRVSLLHSMEKSWRMALGSILATVGVIAFMALVGVPWTARQLALRTPPVVARAASEQAMLGLEKIGALEDTTLSAQRVKELQKRLEHVTAAMPPAPGGYQLILKNAPILGPNAFALPDGRIVMTDQLVALAQTDDELEGVLGHEASHVIRAHGLQSAYQASIIPVLVAFVSGDVASIGQSAVLLPGIVLQSNYSKSFEQEADDDAALALERVGIDPAHLADLLERIEREHCGDEGCGATWLGTHPETVVRAAHLRKE
ncbi:MAG: M48 family metallopeptidase [Pseudomonadales bacterium]|jgi:Zn-dependent protease with chaperone function|nr:M48 family metallopeptidase [Pseudomonadales bacterium]